MVMKIKSLFGYAAAMSLLAWGFSACTEENPENPDDNGGGTTSTIRYRISVDDESITENSVTVNVTCNGTESDTWYAFITDDLDSPTENVIAAAVDALTDVASVLKSGNDAVEFSGLTASTDYRVVVTGLLSDGTVTGTPDEDEFTTSRDPNQWEERTDWTIEYVGRGSLETGSDGSTTYGDIFDFYAPGDGSEYYLATVVAVSEFESTYSNSVANFAAAMISEQEAYMEEYNAMVDYYNEQGYNLPYMTWLDSLMPTYSSPYQATFGVLDADEQWYVFFIGVDPTGEGTGVYAQSEAITPQEGEASDEYNEWLGQWTLGNESNSYTITIAEDIPDYRYAISGWQNSQTYSLPDFHAEYDNSTHSLTFISEDGLASVNDDEYGASTISFVGVIDLGEGATSVVTGGPYPILVVENSSNPTLTAQEVTITGGVTYNIIGMEYVIVPNVSTGTVGTIAGEDAPTFPLTMTRTEVTGSSTYSVSNCPASSVSMFQVTTNWKKTAAKISYVVK